MPELPEVETMRRGIMGVVGARIDDIARMPCQLKPITVAPRIDALRRRVRGQVILDVDRVGKRVVLQLDTDDRLIFEPRMTGLVLLVNPPNVTHLRLRIDLSGSSIDRLWYWDRRGLGSIRLLDPKQFATQLGEPQLGPDALLLTAGQLQSRLQASRREVKVALLDQRAVAGIGNLYASEILHAARVHPMRRCDQLARRDWTVIHAAMREVLEAAIRYEGSTLADGTYRNALNKSGGYQNHHRVYARANGPCETCRTGIIQRIVQAQRATFFCPECQPGYGRRRGRKD